MYKIHADYRGHDYTPWNWYYVEAETKKEARIKFQNKITWLHVYEIEAVDDDFAEEVRSHPRNYILL